ncbi:HAD family acid phosphatase [Mycoplasma crocodyli]|uniref:Putative lipoprotein n=1 Tax=Mycoplasma crocodyli (strain ATCC 51981 / MP145) TaxID=512564 RepID=D5E4U9_MYCCM|nr:HAD family acid phosphatase [Mycoplasma crocodyli]ADE19805.1 putative lipoprotein [Mycoplasma crocodyli MP145]
MKLNKKLFLLGAMIPAVSALSVVAVSCNNGTDKKDATPAEVIEMVKKLTNEDKNKLIHALDVKGILTQDEAANLINTLNKDAAQIGSIVWYIKSAESRIGREQDYALAKIKFDNLIKDATSKWDLGKVEKTTGLVKNPDTDKFIPVVYMDIDETVLSNDFTESRAMTVGGYKPADKENYDLKGVRKATPGAIAFINHVFDKGGVVMYNSDMNQPETVRKAVKENLIKAGVKKEYVQDWQFWMRGSVPYKAADPEKEKKIEEWSKMTPEQAAKVTKEEISALTNDLKFGKEFRKMPWIGWPSSDMAYNIGKLVFKNQRMNATSENTEGWDLGTTGADKVKFRVAMKIGDNFNDFFDEASKKQSNDDRVALYESKDAAMKDLFLNPEGSKGRKYDAETKKWSDLEWKQSYQLITGNSEYGGWLDPYGYKNTYLELWKAIKEIIKDPKDL